MARFLRAHRACTAFRALSLRCSPVILAALAWPSLAPPRFPILTKKSRTSGGSFFLGILRAALALHFAYYNFCRVHSKLRVTPAMEAGAADPVWSVTDLPLAA
jgi:hypothetical protein